MHPCQAFNWSYNFFSFRPIKNELMLSIKFPVSADGMRPEYDDISKSVGNRI